MFDRYCIVGKKHNFNTMDSVGKRKHLFIRIIENLL